jgi:hypothetical protein
MFAHFQFLTVQSSLSSHFFRHVSLVYLILFLCLMFLLSNVSSLLLTYSTRFLNTQAEADRRARMEPAV